MKLPLLLCFIISFLIKFSISKDNIRNIIIKDIRDNQTICVDFESTITFEYDNSYTLINFDENELLHLSENEYKANMETDFVVEITKKFGEWTKRKHFKIVVKRVFNLVERMECMF